MANVEGKVNVLIETLWNVKSVHFLTFLPSGRVLIETLWNVKLPFSGMFHPDLRINRNIMECKVF